MQAFNYAEANSLQSALDLVAAKGAMLIAGGTDMLQLLQEDVLAPPTLIGIGHLPLAAVEVGASGLRIGAMARLAAVADDPRVQQDYPLLAQALTETASPQVRNMATIGGNLLQRTRCLYFRDSTVPCNKREPNSGCPAQDGQNRINAIFGGSPHCIAAYPGDMAVALVALDASVEVQGRQGPRQIKVADFHLPPGDTPQIETALRPGEIVTGIRIPANDFAAGSHYLKVRDRASFEWALVSVAVALQREGELRRRGARGTHRRRRCRHHALAAVARRSGPDRTSHWTRRVLVRPEQRRSRVPIRAPATPTRCGCCKTPSNVRCWPPEVCYERIYWTPISRVDGPEKVTGQAIYAAEFRLKNLAYAALVTSTQAHGWITGIDTSRAVAHARRDRCHHA